MELPDGTVSQHTFRDASGYSNPAESINWPVKGVVVNVLATDDPNNGQGQTLCDVSLIDYNYTLFRLQVFSPHFHQDTRPDAQLSRQRAASRTRDIYDGESWTPRVGSICLVQFIGAPGPQRDAVITAFGPVSNQALPHVNRDSDESIYPREAQAVTVFDAAGNPKEEFRSRLQPTQSESPRYTRVQNGSALEIDNRGNVNVQTTIAREPIEQEIYDDYKYGVARIETTPDPEGNIVLSTRGAKRGNIGLVTGKIATQRKTMQIVGANGEAVREIVLVEELEEQSEEGNVHISTKSAKQGKVTITTQESENGTILIIDKGETSIKFDGEGNLEVDAPEDVTVKAKGNITAEADGNIDANADGNIAAKAGGNATIECGGIARVGTSGASHPVVLGDDLLLWIITTLIFHFHFGVENGRSVTGPSNILPPDILSGTVFVSK